jgi:quinol monooxygenase YgiN
MEITRGLLVRLQAQSGKADEVEAFLKSAEPLARAESTTPAWFAVRFNRSEFAIFDVFADDAGRDAHLAGPIAAALRAQAAALLAEPPKIEKVDVLAAKSGEGGPPALATKGLLLTFAARTGRVDDVESFLHGSQAWVEREAGTLAWYAIRLADGSYGIFDVFADNAGRFAHLTGEVPRELAANALTLLGSFPDMSMLDVLAEKR